MKTEKKLFNNQKIIVLPRYGMIGASSRMRQFQYIQDLEAAGFQVAVKELINNNDLSKRYLNKNHSKIRLLGNYMSRIRFINSASENSILWIEKELMPWIPAMFEMLIIGRRKYILDYDDSIFHNYDLNKSVLLKQVFQGKIGMLMYRANSVVCGNQYLADYASKTNCARVIIAPTAINLKKYPIVSKHPKKASSYSPRIVWIGSPATEKYLDLIQPILLVLNEQCKFRLRIIGSNKKIPGIVVENCQWDEKTENGDIAECDIGVMPIPDGPWERGKCGYKLIQYMASGLPVVASPVGVNCSIVKHGHNGFLPGNMDQWIEGLRILLDDISLRRSFGSNGRESVEKSFNTDVVSPSIVNEFQRLVCKN